MRGSRGDLPFASKGWPAERSRAVLELAKVITPVNRHELLPRAFHRSKAEAKAVAVEIKPVEAPPGRDVVTAVRATPRAVPAPTAPAPVALALDGKQIVHPMNSTSPRPPYPRTERTEVEPPTTDLARLHVTVSKTFLEKLDRARDALSHAQPGASIADLLEAGLDLLLERDLRRKAIVAKPQKTPRPTTTDRIPASVRRAVFLRDGFKMPIPLAERGDLRLDSSARARSPPAAGARRALHDGEPPGGVPPPQWPRCAGDLRRRVDGSVHTAPCIGAA